jgi:RNA polymerase sigma-70 factor (ECF subfamily)
MSDEITAIRKLIQQAKRGDGQAIATIYQNYVDRIFRYIVYRVGSEADAEDLTAEVFLNMVEGLASYEYSGAPFEAWLYRIASRRVADFYRKRGRLQEAELSENIVGSTPQPEEQVLQQQEVSELYAALSQLNEEEQQILILRFVERKSHQAVAEILEKQVSAVKTAQYRALRRLSRLLGSEKKARHYLRGNDG